MNGPSSPAAAYDVVDGRPAVEDYLHLRRIAGLSPRTRAQASAAIGGSWAFVLGLSAAGDAVAMGRIIGDGGWYFVLADMAVHPEHQRRGLGGAILDRLLADVRARAEAGALITLTADPPGRALYASRGFVDVAPQQIGMRLTSG